MTQLLDVLTTNQTAGAVLIAIAGAVLGLWIAAAWWAYADLSRRVRAEPLRLLAPAWILVSSPLLLPLSLAAYLLVRPQETVAERRSREILGALAPTLDPATCPGCEDRVEEGWRRCPSCATWLGAPCSRCGRWSAIELQLCPYCAIDWAIPDAEAPVAPGLVTVATEAPVPTVDLRRARRGRARDDRRAGRAASVSGPRLARIGR